MNKYIHIAEALPQLTNDFNWFHSFIRELYFTTLHCYQKLYDDPGNNLVGDAWAPRDLRFIVAAAGSQSIFGIEFLCTDIQTFSLQKLDELVFNCQIEKDAVRLNFGGPVSTNEGFWVVSKSVFVRFLGKEYLGPSLHLGFEFPREDATDATSIDESWRQCTNCSNAWAERYGVSYSRCPKCGLLTKLLL